MDDLAAQDDRARATDAMMPVSRTMTAIVARTLTEVGQEITVPQLRVLVLLNSRGPMRLSSIAEHLDVNPSNASRTCDQLVGAGKALRDQDAGDRRSVLLRLSDDGARLVAQLMARRRAHRRRRGPHVVRGPQGPRGGARGVLRCRGRSPARGDHRPSRRPTDPLVALTAAPCGSERVGRGHANRRTGYR
jgi:DNA-binding MarR family transcriptional regulator